MFGKKKNNTTKQPQTTQNSAFDKLKAREIKDATAIVGGPDPASRVKIEIEEA